MATFDGRATFDDGAALGGLPFDDRDGFTDGNALAGPLAEVFAVDVTAAESRCANCGRTGPVAELRVYGRAPGFVARCAGCDHVILRLVRGRGIVQLDMRGMISLAVPVGD